MPPAETLHPSGLPAPGGSEPVVLPLDAHNRELIDNVHPTDWVNPQPAARYNLVIIGAGTAGLVTAAGAAGLGARVALVERHLLGGDCLNYGCVPSKCMIRSSRVAGELQKAARLGFLLPEAARAEFPAVMERMRRLRARISHHDSAERFRSLGVDVFLGEARFSSRDTVEVGVKTLRFKRAVLATGARPVHPAIPGLAEAGYHTNETIFSLTELPARLAVIGGGPVGCELAQAFRRLGSEVVLLHGSTQLLNREDPEAAEVLRQTFLREGIRLVLNCRPVRVEPSTSGKTLVFASPAGEERIEVDQILAGAGRAPNVTGLNLEEVGVAYDPKKGVQVDDALRTTNRRIFAAGDVCMEDKHTHGADAAARIVIQNALFLGRKKLSSLVIPRCTYTDPEIAQVGMSGKQAHKAGIEVTTFVRRFSEVDRAILDGEEDGFVKVHVRSGTDKIVGATIVAPHAGEMINEITLAMVGGLGLGVLSGVIHPYPTQSEAIKQAGDAYQRTRLTPFVKKLLSRWMEWTR
jgi:pyruvate/2-oxoglutarate dehydrogenase complex dihydrolipoamide dehydrogenase (E3) component